MQEIFFNSLNLYACMDSSKDEWKERDREKSLMKVLFYFFFGRKCCQFLNEVKEANYR